MYSKLELKNFFAGYSETLPIVGGINLKLTGKKIIGIKGKNGSGKSTLLKGILGLVPYRGGRVSLFEKDVSNWNSGKIAGLGHVGYLSQRDRIFGNLTVRENLEIPEYVKKSAKSKYTLRNLLSSAIFRDLNGYLDYSASILSGGQTLLLALACLMIYDPPMLFLDEPTDSLDEQKTSGILQVLEDWRKAKKAVLLVEQNEDLLSSLPDAVYEITDIAVTQGVLGTSKYAYTLRKATKKISRRSYY